MFGKKERPATEEHFRKWSQIRERGKVYFVLTRGIVVAVVCAVAGFLISEVWWGHKSLRAWHFTIDSAVGLIIAGAVAGSHEWRMNEERYDREWEQFSSANYELPEETMRKLQRGMTDFAKR